MKKGIHPEYHEVLVTCSCGNSFKMNSTMDKKQLNLEVCYNCHPFYTGKQKIVDTGGRVDRFNRRYSKQKTAGAA